MKERLARFVRRGGDGCVAVAFCHSSEGITVRVNTGRIVSSLAAALLALACCAGCAERAQPASFDEVELAVKSYLFVERIEVDGRGFVAARYADAERNSVETLAPGLGADLRRAVRSAIAADFEAHRTEYLVRERVAFRKGPATEGGHREALWTAFLSDPRFRCRLARRLEHEAVETRGFVACTDVHPGRATRQRVSVILETLDEHLGATPEKAGCGAHPTLFARRLPDEDPMLMADVLEIHLARGGTGDPDEVLASLSRRGWDTR